MCRHLILYYGAADAVPEAVVATVKRYLSCPVLARFAADCPSSQQILNSGISVGVALSQEEGWR